MYLAPARLGRGMSLVESLSYGGASYKTQFLSSTEVFPGVVCDAYLLVETQERDLGVIYIQAGRRTKPQKVLDGIETIEGYVSGRGSLIIVKPSGEPLEFKVGPGSEGFSYPVDVVDIMQWRADAGDNLVVFEICFPPYQAGRFEDLDDSALK